MGILNMFGQGREHGGQVADHRHVILAAAVDHILTDNHTQPVTVIIPAGTFHLDVLAQHIKAQFFHGTDVIEQGFVGRGSVQSVRPVTLIQNTHQEIRLMI